MANKLNNECMNIYKKLLQDRELNVKEIILVGFSNFYNVVEEKAWQIQVWASGIPVERSITTELSLQII